MPFVFSTITSDVAFVEYAKDAPDGSVPSVVRRVEVKGGANRADRHAETPPAARTEVSDDDAAFLATHDSFARYVRDGFLRLERRRVDLEVPAADMTRKDKCAPFVPEDFKKPPTIGRAAA